MLRVKDIMTTDVLSVAPETSLREAMELLGGRHVSGAPVVSGGRLVGVVSATDLMTFLSGIAGVPAAHELNEDATVWDGPSVEVDAEAERVPGSAYFADYWDDAGADVTVRTDSVEGPEWNVLEEHDVSEVMTRAPLSTLSPNADAEAAADLMREKRIHRVFVTNDDGSLVGVVSALDIARAVAEHRFPRRTVAFNRDADYRDG